MYQAQATSESNPKERQSDEKPLPLHKLVRIWRGLPEGERYGFILSLDEAIADQVITATAQAR